MQGQVRAVLWKHLASRQATADPTGTDAGAFLPAAEFSQVLAGMDEQAQISAGEAYAVLWARTFPTLTRHLRGRPHHAVRLFVEEVYPYLRGTRRAGQARRTADGRTEVLLQADLPVAYLTGLLQGFATLSGATATIEHAGDERFLLSTRLAPGDRLAWVVQWAGRLRIPLLATSVLAAAVGFLLAGARGLVDLGAVLGGAFGAQLAANAVHDLRNADRELHLGQAAPARAWSWTLAAGGYLLAMSSLVWFLSHGRPGVLAFAAAGLVGTLAYAAWRDRGLGPLLAGLSHGPVVVLGAAHVASGAWSFSGPLLAAAIGLGSLTSAVVFLGNMADRPLDEAAGKRTLAVRIPATQHVLGLAACLAVGLVGIALAAWPPVALQAAALVALVIAAAVVLGLVARRADDPRRLTVPRLLLFILHMALGAWLLTGVVS